MAKDILINITAKETGFEGAAQNILKYDRAVSDVERATKQLDKAHAKGKISTAKYERGIEALIKDLYRLDDAYLQSANSASFSSKSASKFGLYAQQAGYQVGDFAVQIQGGQNAMVALGQQGSQLLGIFGPAGAIAGAALAITTGIVAPFIRANEETEKTIRNLDEINSSIYAIKLGESEELTKARKEVERLIEVSVEMEKTWDNMDAQGFDTTQRRLNLENMILEALEDQGQVQQTLIDEVMAQEAADKLVNERLEEARDLLFVQEDAVEALVDTANVLESVWGKIVDKVIDATAEMRAAQMEAKVFSNVASGAVASDQDIQDMVDNIFKPAQRRIARENKPKKPKRGGGGKENKDVIGDLTRELELSIELLGMDEARAAVIRSLGVDYQNYSDTAIDSLVKLQEELLEQEEALATQADLIQGLTDPAKDFFNSILDGSASAEDAFKEMLRSMISSVYDLLVLQPMIENFQKILGGSGSGGSGGIIDLIGSAITGFSGGKVGASKTSAMAPQASAMASNKSLAIAPAQSSTPSVGASPAVTQVFNIKGNGDDFLKNAMRVEIQRAAPQLISASKDAVINERRRGGVMKAAFG